MFQDISELCRSSFRYLARGFQADDSRDQFLCFKISASPATIFKVLDTEPSEWMIVEVNSYASRYQLVLLIILKVLD